MDARLSVVVALVIAGVFPAMALYAWQAQAGVYTEEGAAQVAIHFLRNGPTFRFDGIPESIDVIETRILESHPVQYVITIEFECRHAGYGDRTGQILAQVITPHEMAVTVVEGRVVRAVIDGAWDELEQREVARSELLPPEFARDLAIQYILEGHPELGAVPLPEAWAFEDLTPEGLVGISIQRFTGGGWTVNVSHPVVWKPTYAVEIEHEGEVSFRWEGAVDQGGNVEEISYAR